MSLAFLKTELSALAAQAKRRNTDLHAAVERSLQIAEPLKDDDMADLRKSPEFITPFLLACSAANAKSCASALQCLQTLAAAGGIAPSRLSDLLKSLLDAAQLGIGIQLKILQLLPVLLQSYQAEITGPLVIELLRVCAEMQGQNKVGMVHNTAYATLQQLISGLFDRVGKIDSGKRQSLELDGQLFELSLPVYDGACILVDLCDIADKQPPQFCTFSDLPLPLTLELLELTLTNNASAFHDMPVFAKILKERITPLLVRLFTESNEFAISLRIARIFYLVLRRHLDLVPEGSQVTIALLTQTMVQDHPLWKQVLCLEVFQGVFSELPLVRTIYSMYDAEGHAVVRPVLDAFAKILAGGRLGLAGEPAGAQLSKAVTMRVPCIDLLDKTEPPRVTPLYLDYLVLVCINALADGINRAASRRSADENLAKLLRDLASPLLACFSILVGAAIDMELYRLVVRSIQRVAHSAGVMDFVDTRNEYMQLLAQNCRLPRDDENEDDEEKPELKTPAYARPILCIRALFNLGYALGNQLGDTWTLIVKVIGQLADQIGLPEYSKERLMGLSDADAPIDAALRKLLDQSDDFDDDALSAFVSALGTSIRPIYLSCVRYLASANIDRLSASGSVAWLAITDLLLATAHDPVQGEFRLPAAEVLDDIALETMGRTTEAATQRSIIAAIARQGQVPDGASKSYDKGAVAVQLAAIRTLNQLLDTYGSRLSSGWEDVFEVISGAFRLDSEPHARDLVKSSFESLELVCSDFLDSLPYPCVVDLTVCLDQFARQTLDLNIAFTATSLFWTVCDHLLKSPCGDFPEVDSEEKLVELAQDGTHKQHALWMLAQIKLAQIANEPQHQVKTGAIQIFFRLFDAHGRYLSPQAWSVCHKLVLPHVMEIAPDADAKDRNETLGLLVGGLGKLWFSKLDIFVGLPDFDKFWAELMSYFAKMAPLSAPVAKAVYDEVEQLLLAPQAKKLPAQPLWGFWSCQNPNPEPEPERTAVQALERYVKLYVLLGKVLELSAAQQIQAVQLISKCARYPHSGGYFGKGKPSDLQTECLNILQSFDVSKPPLANAVVGTLSSLAQLPFEDTEADPELYVGLSARAQELLLKLMGPESAGSAIDKDVSQSTLAAMVTIMSHGGQREKATEIFLGLLPACLGLPVVQNVGAATTASPIDRREPLSDSVQDQFNKSIESEEADAKHGGVSSEAAAAGKGARQIQKAISQTQGTSKQTTEPKDDPVVEASLTPALEGGKTLLEGGNANDEEADIASMAVYISIVERRDCQELWKPLLQELLLASLLYERGLYTRAFFEGLVTLSDAERAEEIEKTTVLSLFGTIEPPRRCLRPRVGYFCLRELQRLSLTGSRGAAYAADLYSARVRVVLAQYVGDSRLRSLEPLSHILKEELLVVLAQLRGQPAHIDLLTRCVTSNDAQVRQCVQDILVNPLVLKVN